ncbi:hypothetical protein F0L74_00295 [Chitinophaga agrisoli]|uniref:Outer membrane protein with beta-barrel domain n=1 Tax=Chitinophaga agrisoli TaxID=2607653 RepID=A0A5B2W0K5_9BACT|nr:DUF6048 family protein [Chitinophaga agrisoli]KAA2244458.1 hypothetical protein F0L74_00295 [Chitinophaga agrisoli]
MIPRILRYTLGFSLWLSAAQAQVKPVTPPVTDTSVHRTDTTAHKADTIKPKAAAVVLPDSVYTVPGGLRIGLDLARFVVKAFQPYRTDVTVVGDYRIKKDLYLAAEAGWQSTSHSDTNYTYKGRGVFVTAGVDYNLLKKLLPQERYMIFAGIRYGFAQMSYEAPSYTISNSYWGDKLPGSVPKTNTSAHWVELIMGIKAEVLKNLFLGWNIREKILVSGPKDDIFPPIAIPGFGSGTKKSQFDWQYTISYCIPLNDIKVHVPRTPPKK